MAQRGSARSDNIQRWLQLVTKHSTPESLKFVKLCLYSEMDYAHYECIDTPIGLFNHLLVDCYGSNEEKTFQIFVNALRHSGSSLRGKYLLQRLPEFDLTCPPLLLDEDLSKEAQFCICLAKIAVKSRGSDIEKKLLRHFCRPPSLDMHSDNVPHLPDLFVKLMHNKIIWWDNTKCLAESLEKYDARQCLKCLNKYYKKVELPPLPSYESDEEDDGM